MAIIIIVRFDFLTPLYVKSMSFVFSLRHAKNHGPIEYSSSWVERSNRLLHAQSCGVGAKVIDIRGLGWTLTDEGTI